MRRWAPSVLVSLSTVCLGLWLVASGVAAQESAFQERRLSNGMRAIVEERPSSRVAALSVGIRGGSRNEDAGTVGAAHFMEHMYFQGTPRRPSISISQQELEAVGGWSNAWTGVEAINFQVMVPAEAFDLGLDLLSDNLVNATFPAEQLERERKVVIQELRGDENVPWRYALQLLQPRVLRDHPARQLPGGSRDTVATITRETILKFRDAYFVARNMVVAVSGNVRADEVFPKLEAAFHDMRQGPAPDAGRVAVPVAQASRFELQAPIRQAQVALGVPTVGADHPDRYALEMTAALLGSGGQRLRASLVDREAAASSVGSNYWDFTDVGMWLALVSADPSDVERAIQLLQGELRRLRDEPPTDQEVSETLSFLAGRARLGQEGSMAQAVSLSDGLVTGTYEPLDTFLARLAAITPRDIQQVAQRYLDPTKLTVVVLKPRAS